MAMGMVKETKAAQAPMLNIAPMARSPPKIRRSRSVPIVVLSQTALTGVCVWVFTWRQWRERGKQSSRA
jgi:hypothetical protein